MPPETAPEDNDFVIGAAPPGRGEDPAEHDLEPGAGEPPTGEP